MIKVKLVNPSGYTYFYDTVRIHIPSTKTHLESFNL